MSDIWPTWEDWLAGVDPDARRQAEGLRRTFSRLDATDPEDWARSEVSEGFAQLACYVFLRSVWRAVEPWRDGTTVKDMIPDAPTELLVAAQAAASRAAFDVAFALLQLLDDEKGDESSEPLPGWRLMELDPSGAETGRDLLGLHESFLTADPRHIEGEDIRGW